jgi:hypothetical protein
MVYELEWEAETVWPLTGKKPVLMLEDPFSHPIGTEFTDSYSGLYLASRGFIEDQI